MILIRKRPDGFFERVYPDGSRELFTLPPVDPDGSEESGETIAAVFGIQNRRQGASPASVASGSGFP